MEIQAVPALSLAGVICTIILSIGLPIMLIVVGKKKFGARISTFFIGAGTFVLFALVLEQILHMVVMGVCGLSQDRNEWLYYIYAAAAAAVFEESGRIIAMKYFMKSRFNFSDAFMYGVGHGGIEALSVGIDNIFLILFSSDYLASTGASVALAGVERISTQIAQIAFSFIVFYAFHKKKYRYLMLAIVLHTVYDFSVILLNYGLSPSVLEMLLFVVSIVLLLFTMKYKKGVFQNEENC